MQVLAVSPKRPPAGSGGPSWATDELFMEAIADFKTDALFFNETVAEPISYRLRNGFDTACWTFRNGQHYVFLGTGILRRDDPQIKALTPETAKEYLKKFLGHEYGHALATIRKVESFACRLERAGIPFSLWNLFEDSRIERYKRTVNDFKFEWLEFESFTTRVAAKALFFLMVQAEGNQAKVRRLVEDAPEPGAQELYERVLPFYIRAVSCRNSTDLYPLLKEWLMTFPEEVRPSSSKGKNGEGRGKDGEGLQDLELSYQLMSDERKFTAFINSSTAADAPLVGTAEDLPPDLKDVIPDGNERSYNAIDFLADCPPNQHGIDGVRVSQVADTLKRLLTQTTVKRYSVMPSKRFNARRDLLDLPAYRHDPQDMRPLLNLTVFLDCSGSMAGQPMQEAKILLGALSMLAVHKRLTGYLVLSTASYGNKTYHHRLKFPLSSTELENIHAMSGGEGLEPAIMDPANLRIASASDFVYVITDANITDTPIDKDTLHKRGIYTTGIYVGKNGAPQKMDMYFDRSLIRESIEEVVQALLEKLK